MSEEFEEDIEDNDDNEDVEDDVEDVEADSQEIELIKYNGECKYFHHEPYMTPNNYDISYNHDKIPSNIKPETALNLQKRLQKLMPLTKFIHVQLNTEHKEYLNHVDVITKMKINNQEVKFL